MILPPPRSPPFPYTTLFRSIRRQPEPGEDAAHLAVGAPLRRVDRHVPQQPAPPRRVLREDLRRRAVDDDEVVEDRKSTRLNSSHANISYAVFCLKKKNQYYL